MKLNNLFLQFKKIYNFISIILKEIIKNKKNNNSKKSLFYCCKNSFFSTFIIILINGIINGFYKNAIESVKLLNGDLTINFNKNISFKDSEKLFEIFKKEKDLKINKIFFFGLIPIFLSKNEKLIPLNILILNIDYIKYLKEKLNFNLNNKDEFYEKNNFIFINSNFKKYFNNNNNECYLLFLDYFKKNKDYIKCNKLKINIDEFLDINSDEFLNLIFFLNIEFLEKKYKKNLINNLIIFFEKNLDQEKIKIKINTILKDNKIDYAISSLEDNYFDYFKIIRIQLYSSYLISFLLFLFSILINFNTLSIFIEQKKRDFLA